MKKSLTFFVLGSFVLGCSPLSSASKGSRLLEDVPLPTQSDAPWCRPGFEYNVSSRLCESDTEASGPFTQKMIEACLTATLGDDSCQGTRWSRELARDLRGSDPCPLGTLPSNGLCIEGESAFGPFPSAAVLDCIQDSRRGEVCFSGKWSLAIATAYVKGASSAPVPRPNPSTETTRLPDPSTIPLPEASDDVWCLPGFTYNSSTRLCESPTEALGFFTDRMVGRCIQEFRGDAACSNILWDKDVARGFRGNGTCPDGSTLQGGLCIEGDDAFGPFPAWAVRKCMEQRHGKACAYPRWSARVARWIFRGRIWQAGTPPVPAPAPAPNPVGPTPIVSGDANEAFAAWYVNNYDSVYHEAVGIIGSTSNACSTFASSALRKFGYDIPITPWAPNLRALLGRLGWEHITRPADLQPGDVVFTEDPVSMRTGETGHVYVVRSLAGPRHVYALDNQGRNEYRNLHRNDSPYNWWFWDGYRPPVRK